MHRCPAPPPVVEDVQALVSLVTDKSSQPLPSPTRRAGFAEGRVDPTTWAPDVTVVGRRKDFRAKSCALAPVCGARTTFRFSDELLAPHEKEARDALPKPGTRLYAFKSVRGSKMREDFPTYQFPINVDQRPPDEDQLSCASDTSDWHLCQRSLHPGRAELLAARVRLTPRCAPKK